MREALLIVAFLPSLAGAAGLEEIRPADAAPTPLSAQGPMAARGLPPALSAALSSLAIELPAVQAASFDGIGALAAVKAAAAYYGADVSAPTPEQALKIRVMKAMADTFLMSKGLWDDGKMAARTADNPSGLAGIVVSNRPGGFGVSAVYSPRDKYIVLRASQVDRVPTARAASSLLHELVHHLNPHPSRDEVLSHILQAEFDEFAEKWLATAGLDHRLEPRSWLSPLKGLLTQDLLFRFESWQLRRAYASGRMLSHVAASYYKPIPRSSASYYRMGSRRATAYNAGGSYDGLGFAEGSAGARRDLERFRAEAARYRRELTTEAGEKKRADLQRWIAELDERIRGYERVAIPTLEDYERATGSGLPK